MSYASEVLADSPVGYWRMEQSSGNITNEVAGNSITVFTNAPTQGAAGRVGNAISLASASNQAARVAHYTALNVGDVFTVEAWIKLASTGVAHQICSEANGGPQLWINTDGKLRLTKANIAHIAPSVAAITNTNWHHVVATKNGATVKLYIDGTETTGTVTNQTCTSPGNGFSIGSVWDGSIYGDPPYYNGSIDEVAIYNTAISASRVTAHYNAAMGIDVIATTATVSFSAFAAIIPNVSVTASSVRTISFNAFAANVGAVGNPSIGAEVATVAFTGLSASVTIFNPTHVTVTATVAVIGFTALDATLNFRTYWVEYDGTQPSIGSTGWINAPVISGGGTPPGAAFSTIDFWGVKSVFVDGSWHLAIGSALVFEELTDLIGSQEATNYTLSIDYAYYETGTPGTVHRIQMTTLRNYPLTDAVLTVFNHTSSGTIGWTQGTINVQVKDYNDATLRSTLEKNRRYSIGLLINPIYESGPDALLRVDKLTWSWDPPVITTVVPANTPTISFSAFAATTPTSNFKTITVDNTPIVTLQTYSVSTSTNNTNDIGADLKTISFVAFPVTLVATAVPTQLITNTPVIQYIGRDASINISNDVLTFVFIDKEDTNYTARDAVQVISFNLGALLFNESKVEGFRLGNLSAIPTHFGIQAVSNNNLASMVTFSVDKVTYTPTLIIESVLPNAVTDAIWVKLTATTSAYIDEGTFLINVEQVNA